MTLWNVASKVLMLPLITSVKQNRANPPTSKIPVASKTILTNAFHCLGFFLKITTSIMVMKEMPPKIINIII